MDLPFFVLLRAHANNDWEDIAVLRTTIFLRNNASMDIIVFRTLIFTIYTTIGSFSAF
jgi:hypothetical protein